ncbi:phage holin family protein [Bacillus sp. FJAT-42376]|uniref:phage holin family protein n=1 Tax=Bacillus sp. FJAT-42376 TaxID=2014076 RepID=UPI000F4E3999|nr:phage holin family protein [Bacillus sp. FJAT-42376]AZB44451.1 phage holin family protein [Bacillus sp. FJAT-42376]
MIRWIISVLINAVILMVCALIFKDDFQIVSIWAAVIASLVLSIINVLIKPFLIILTLPVTVLTLGLFLFVINAITLMITQGIMGDAFNISGFGTSLLASIVISLLHLIVQKGVIEPMRENK